jgi:RNA recognition motif-containing protein
LRFAFQPFYAAKRLDTQWVHKKPHTQSKRHEQRKIKYGQNYPTDLIADELADLFPSFPNFSQSFHFPTTPTELFFLSRIPMKRVASMSTLSRDFTKGVPP